MTTRTDRALVARALMLGIAITLGACGGGDDGAATPDAAGPAALEPAPPAGGQQLASDPIELAAGEEKYLCFTFYSPDDREVAITEATTIGAPGLHHIALFKPLVPENERAFDCSDKIVEVTWEPIWAGGTNSPALTLPAGVGFKLGPATQYLLQLHVQNASDAPLSLRAGVNLRYAEPAATAGLIPAGIFALGTFNLEIPARAVDFAYEVDCALDRTLNVFAMFPHMHKLGTHIDLQHGVGAEGALAKVYELNPYRFADQPIDPVTEVFAPGDRLRATCYWDNPSDQPVMFGESTNNEMCFFTMFYYPFESLAGCIE